MKRVSENSVERGTVAAGDRPTGVEEARDPRVVGGDGAAESARLGLAFVSGLVAGGVREVVVSPGSRSTPLVLALRSFPRLRARVILDERSAAFFALGLADRTHRPVALVCTSGTAGANYLPAAVEAWHRRVPLLLLTADRPPELRDCGAGQTIDQPGLYGHHVRWSVDAAAPPGATGERYLSAVAREALRRATAPVPGPVQVNLPFREPFLPGAAVAAGVGQDDEAGGSVGPEASVAGSPDRTDWEEVRRAGPGWIVAGAANPSDPAAWADGLFRLGDWLGWPVLCDVTNPGRHAKGAADRVVTQYEGLLAGGRPAPGDPERPSAVLQAGPLPTAKSLRRWLEGFGGPRWQWSDDPACLDPARSGAAWIPGNPSRLGALPGEFARDDFRGRWLALEKAAVEKVADWLAGQPESFEGKIHRRIAEALPKDRQVFWSNSLPVRDAERFWFADRAGGGRAFANRGASGIDGIVSTAAGLADGGPPTLAVVGDLAFLHDCGGLRAAAAVEGCLDLLVLDNGGGRIFGQLPVAGETDVFEGYFLTPQAVDLAALGRAHGIETRVAKAGEDLAAILREDRSGTRIVIVKTDAARDPLRRREWAALFDGVWEWTR